MARSSVRSWCGKAAPRCQVQKRTPPARMLPSNAVRILDRVMSPSERQSPSFAQKVPFATASDRMAVLHRYLDPSTSLAEILFGLIMTLTFTLGAGLMIEAEV